MGGTNVPDVGNGTCLCTKHHRELHVMWFDVFQTYYNLDLFARAKQLGEWYTDGKPFLEE